MALLFLLISFFSSLYGAWVFLSGYFGAESATQQLTAAMSGIGFALIPYLVGKSLSEMIALRQRHLMVEQTGFQQEMMMQAMGEMAQEQAAKSAPQPAQAPTPPPPLS